MLAVLTFVLIGASTLTAPPCEVQLINADLHKIEIADYDATARPPSPSDVALLYQNIALRIASCAGSARHYMTSRTTDMLESATYAKFSALEYFQLHDLGEGCKMLGLARRESQAAKAVGGHASSYDRLMLNASAKNTASIEDLRSRQCAR